MRVTFVPRRFSGTLERMSVPRADFVINIQFDKGRQSVLTILSLPKHRKPSHLHVSNPRLGASTKPWVIRIPNHFRHRVRSPTIRMELTLSRRRQILARTQLRMIQLTINQNHQIHPAASQSNQERVAKLLLMIQRIISPLDRLTEMKERRSRQIAVQSYECILQHRYRNAGTQEYQESYGQGTLCSLSK